MSALLPYLGIVFALFVGVVASLSFHPFEVAYTPMATTTAALHAPILEQPAPIASSTPPVVATTSAPAEPAKTTPTPKAKPAPTPVTTTTTVAAPVATTTYPQTVPSSLFDTAAAKLRSALVNILCYAPAGGKLHSISGSGIFIDDKGIILTNAHIGQYFLLANRGVSCTIRTGSPAVDTYYASPIYISPAWLYANPNVLTTAEPSGTGQYDFALVAVTDSATADPLPATFPSVPLANLVPATGASVVIASYGAQFLQTSQVQTNLNPIIVFGSVKQIMTFTSNTPDVLNLGGSAAAQEGSSGGGAADISGSLVGTITTSTTDGATATRQLDAITATYIRSEYARETGSSLDTLLQAPLSDSVSAFAAQLKALESIITPQLQ